MAGFFSALRRSQTGDAASGVAPKKRGTKTPPSAAQQPFRDFSVTDPFDIDLGEGAAVDPLIYMMTAVLLGYPDERLLSILPDVEELAEKTGDEEFYRAVVRVADWLRSDALSEVQGSYVQEYDLSRRHSLNLSYWTDGDTRRRGAALSRIKQVYRDSGMLTDLHGELPDYLPMVLEFAAQADMRRGRAVLQAYRPSLELLRLALRDGDLPHEGLIARICASLPGPSPQTQEDIQAMAGYGPPQESVGLGFDDPRLLPIVEKNTTGALT